MLELLAQLLLALVLHVQQALILLRVLQRVHHALQVTMLQSLAGIQVRFALLVLLVIFQVLQECLTAMFLEQEATPILLVVHTANLVHQEPPPL